MGSTEALLAGEGGLGTEGEGGELPNSKRSERVLHVVREGEGGVLANS